ncbi:MAG: alkaline ceramidase [Propionibacteriaceae bacterium]
MADITPPGPAGMAGFVARLSESTGVHDQLTARALCIDDTAILTLDLCGVDEDFCHRVAVRCAIPTAGVLVHAIHTHSAAQSIPGHPAEEPDQEWLSTVEDACVRTLDEASRSRTSAKLFAGWGAAAGIAKNRRRPDGPVDDSLPVLEVTTTTGEPLAILVSYACHPVVLGAHNTELSADYPGHLRRVLEEHRPGAMALFATGCAGDLNTGHSAQASMQQAGSPNRTHGEARRIGTVIAEAALTADLTEVTGPARGDSTEVVLQCEVPTRATLLAQSAEWREAKRSASDPVDIKINKIWADWADVLAPTADEHLTQRPWPAQVSALHWGDFRLVALPGEPFCVIGMRIREALATTGVSMVLGYTGGYAGYLPTADEYPLGGYEPCESHRYRGLPGPFVPGTDEQLVSVAGMTSQGLDQPTGS